MSSFQKYNKTCRVTPSNLNIIHEEKTSETDDSYINRFTKTAGLIQIV